MPPREGQRVIDKLRGLAAVTGYWPLVIAVLLLVRLPYIKLDYEQEERMRIWSQLVQMSTEEDTASYQPAMDMIWQRGEEFAQYRVIARALPLILLVSAVVFRKRIRGWLRIAGSAPSDPKAIEPVRIESETIERTQ